MTRISDLAQRYLLGVLVAAFLAGAIFGLVVLGWNVWPVQYTGNAAPADLDAAGQRVYLTMAAEAYAATGDAVAARERVSALVSANRSQGQVISELQALARERATAGDAQGAQRLQMLATAVTGQATPLPTPGAAPGPAARESTGFPASLFRACGMIILVLVLIAGVLLLVYFLQSRTSPAGAEEATDSEKDEEEEGPVLAPAPATVSPPAMSQPVAPRAPVAPAPAAVTEAGALGPFVATYNLGDIDFDMSFGIESASGDFLGECGLGMAETIGGGDVQRVTAFEVWLFDKTDIRTVSVVLASAHAHADAALRTKLASRGEIVLAQPGASFVVKTSSLKLEGKILDMAYGSGDGPAQSYFTTFSVELVPVPLLPGQK